MLINIAFIIFFFVAAVSTSCHAIGLWLVLMLTHGMLYESFGDTAVHIPLYCGLVVTAVIVVRGQWHSVPPSILLAFVSLVIVMLLAGAQGVNTGASLSTTIIYAKGMLLSLLLAGSLRSGDDIRLMTVYCLFGLTSGALYGLFQHLTGSYAISTIYEQRMHGLRGDPNDTAMLLVTGVPMAAYWVLRSKQILRRIFFTGIGFLLIFGIALTGSRGGFVTLALIALAIFIKKPSVQLAIVGIVVGIMLVAAAPATFMDRMETLVTGHDKHGGQSMNNRSRLQIGGLRLFMDNPVLGVGPGNFGRAYAQIVSGGSAMSEGSLLESEDFATGFGVAHNMHLEFFVETGFIGGTLFWMILFQAITSMVRFDRYRQSLGCSDIGYFMALALGGMLFAGLFLSQGKNSVLWFMVGIGLAMRQIGNREGLPQRSFPAQGGDRWKAENSLA